MDLLAAIRDFVEMHGKDERYKPAIEALTGVVDKLKEANPHSREVTSPGKLAARLAALGEEETPAEEAKETPAQEAAEPGEAPKTFADAKAAALEMVGR